MLSLELLNSSVNIDLLRDIPTLPDVPGKILIFLGRLYCLNCLYCLHFNNDLKLLFIAHFNIFVLFIYLNIYLFILRTCGGVLW